MSGPAGSSLWFGETDYEIEQSIRFNAGSTSYLVRTPVAAGSRKIFTFSFWFKPTAFIDDNQCFIQALANNNFIQLGRSGLSSNRDCSLLIGGNGITINTSMRFRDYSNWYHIVVAYDTSDGTAANRVKVYVNGVQQTSFQTATYPSQNQDQNFTNNVEHRIGYDTVDYLDAYLAEFHCIDGAQKAPTDFGTTGEYGKWKPIAYTGTYGTTGFYLPFNTSQGIIAAAGGSITTVGDYKVHSFTSDGTFTPSSVAAVGGFVEYLVVAGGGAAGRSWNWGGGGGAGGMRDGYLEVAAQAYTITVGAGGVKGTNGGNGGNSVFSSITSTGGGAGRSGYGGDSPDYQSPTAGGSGGGSISGAGAGIAGQGFAGGNGTGGSNPHAGGGGGAGEPGSTDAIMDGGDGRPSFITGSSVTYAGGGAGSREDNAKGAAGAGGGGSNAAGTNGLGGGAGSAAADTNGGSGIVIIKYRYQ
jgi:hypothetical protein